MTKRGSDDIFLIDLSAKGIGSIVKSLNKTIIKTTKINDHIIGLKKVFTRYEEPFCEIRQNHKGMKISVKLPDVKKKDIFLNVSQNAIEVKASAIIKNKSKKDILKNYHRVINIPPCSLPQKTTVDYKSSKLKINLPYAKVGQ